MGETALAHYPLQLPPANESAVRLQPAPGDFASLARGGKRAAGLRYVAAVAKAALPEPGPKLDEGGRELDRVQMMQPEFLHAGRVDDMAAGIEVIEPRLRRGVAARVERGGDLGDAHGGCREQSVDDGGLTHSRLAHQHAGLAFQMRRQWAQVALGR